MNKGFSASIVIPHRDRPEMLERCLASLREQSLPAESFEVLVVDDHSSDDALQRAGTMTQAAGAKLIRNSRRAFSAAGARNTGAMQAQFPWLLFLDCDCIASPGWMESLIALPRHEGAIDILPTTAGALSTQTLPFIAGAQTGGDCLQEKIAGNPLAQDLRLGHANGPNGEFSDHPAPWVFCWTTGLLLSAKFLLQAGYFNENFPAKGSEDIALGYELFRAGGEFRLAPVAPLLHTPHSRNHAKEEMQDRQHERMMLQIHPHIEVEMLCAFDASNTADALRALATPPPVVEPLSLSPREIEFLRQQGGRLGLLGELAETSRKALDPAFQASPYFRGRETDCHWSLLGLALPLEDREMDAILITDKREFLPESLISRIFQEASRVALRIFYAMSERCPARCSRVSDRTSRTFDRPYWERSFPLSRTYRDWCSIQTVPESRQLLEIIPSK